MEYISLFKHKALDLRAVIISRGAPLVTPNQTIKQLSTVQIIWVLGQTI